MRIENLEKEFAFINNVEQFKNARAYYEQLTKGTKVLILEMSEKFSDKLHEINITSLAVYRARLYNISITFSEEMYKHQYIDMYGVHIALLILNGDMEWMKNNIY